MQTNEVLELLKSTLPYYESEDRDDFIYLARLPDLEKAAQKIASHLQPEAGTDEPDELEAAFHDAFKGITKVTRHEAEVCPICKKRAEAAALGSERK